MKKLMVAVLAVASLGAFAADVKATEKAPEAEIQSENGLTFWGFGDYGIYSGYQLYGSIVNSEPTMQSYAEINANMLCKGVDLGYLGVGLWHNSDLTGKRSYSLRRAFNEFDPNFHWGRTFWFDDDNTIGLDYRMTFVWFWYPGERHGGTATTMDWDHSLALVNPWVIPYVNFIHEYHESNGNLIQFGLKKPFDGLFGVDGLSATPFVELVYRDSNYGWCFSNYGNEPNYADKIGSGLGTLKIELDTKYMFTKNFGVFAKVAYCQNLDPNLREAADWCNHSSVDNGAAYGRYNEFVWGGVGVCLSF